MQINEKYGHFIHNFQGHSLSVLFTPGTHLPTPGSVLASAAHIPTPGSFQDLKMLFLK